MTVLERILQLIKHKKITQIQFAKTFEHLGVKKQTITDWKSGKSNSYYPILLEIADYFGVSTDYLYGRKESLPSNYLVEPKIVAMVYEDELKLLAGYRELDVIQRDELLQSVSLHIEPPKPKKRKRRSGVDTAVSRDIFIILDE